MFSLVLLMVLISSPLMVESCGTSPTGSATTTTAAGATTTTTAAGDTTATTAAADNPNQATVTFSAAEKTANAAQETAAVAKAAENMAAADTAITNAGISKDAVNAELDAYAKDPVHLNSVNNIIANNLPASVSRETFNTISAEIKGKFQSGELDALESYQLILKQVNLKAGADSPALTAKVQAYFNQPQHLVKLQDILKAQDPNVDPAVATAVANALKAT